MEEPEERKIEIILKNQKPENEDENK